MHDTITETKLPYGNAIITDPLNDAGLNWSLTKVPLQCSINNISRTVDQSALVRDNRILLTTVPKNWKITQNSEFVSQIEKITKDNDISLIYGGEFKRGLQTWFMGESNTHSFNLSDDDRVSMGLLMTNPHSYGSAFSIQCVPIRTITGVSFAFPIKSKTIVNAIAQANDMFEKFQEQVKFLNTKKFNTEKIQQYLNKVLPALGNNQISRPSLEIIRILDDPPEGKLSLGTWWQAFNAVAYYMDFVSGIGAETRIHSSWYGRNRKLKELALHEALSFATLLS